MIAHSNNENQFTSQQHKKHPILIYLSGIIDQKKQTTKNCFPYTVRDMFCDDQLFILFI